MPALSSLLKTEPGKCVVDSGFLPFFCEELNLWFSSFPSLPFFSFREREKKKSKHGVYDFLWK